MKKKKEKLAISESKDLTVQDLIDELQKIEDKTKKVYHMPHAFDEAIREVVVYENGTKLYFTKMRYGLDPHKLHLIVK